MCARRIVATALFAALTLFAVPVNMTAQPNVESAIGLITTNIENSEGFCTIFAVGPHVLLTAGHCVGGVGESHKVRFFHGDQRTEVMAFVMFRGFTDSDGRDLAVLRTGETLTSYLPLSAGEPQPGEQVEDIGHAFGLLYYTSFGKVTGDYWEFPSMTRIVVVKDPDVYPGMSGSPLLNGSGRVAGVLSGISEGRGDMALYTSTVTIQEVLKGLELLGQVDLR